jgi:hypothetical protein
LASGREAVHIRFMMNTRLLLLATLMLTGCTMQPLHGEIIHGRTVTFRGYGTTPDSLVLVKSYQRRPNGQRAYLTAAFTRTNASPEPFTIPTSAPLYRWTAVVDLTDDKHWQSRQAWLRAEVREADAGWVSTWMYDDEGYNCLVGRIADAVNSHTELNVANAGIECSRISNGGNDRNEIVVVDEHL